MRRRLQYYDLILLAISASLLFGLLLGILTPVPLRLSVAVLALLATALVIHAIFINGPVEKVADLRRDVEVEELPAVESAKSLFEH